ncbi:efflux RND transporter periplasmic adaptor subunit [Fulvivirgaceae bacterium PWU5]|uniref:Efflux RND transporter periplasmic adaptor subunit n=1 Tax=Dawidia cretensis TaxID=2782350 RepID=A0AAP2DW06_9BACT|nr:efflux RND transporter periplasmic adaptor subunit [Dawidia cretensis]MBT1708400.1 efflux RND transporter periplasmic adaptor subunit [Dawidia cretensis]
MKMYMPFLLIVSTTLLLTGCSQGNATTSGEKKLPELEVLTLKAQNVTIPRDYICEINGVEYVEIHARVQGYLEDILVDEGQFVKKNQPLFRISSHAYSEMVTKAEAALQRAIAEAKTKRLEVDRIRLMVDKNVISKMELEVATAQKEASESTVREARSVLENAHINLNYTFIRAPFDGILGRIPFKKGSLINSGTLLTSLSNIQEVFAYFQMSEPEYLRLLGKEIKGRQFKEEHQTVSLVLADGSTYPFEGKIEALAGDFDQETGSIAVRARFPNPDKTLKHGSTGKVLLHKTWQNAVLVPQESTFAIQDKSYVYVLDEHNVARVRNFSALARYDKYFVVNGLRQGDRIITEGLQQLRDGVPIKPRHLSVDSARLMQS